MRPGDTMRMMDWYRDNYRSPEWLLKLRGGKFVKAVVMAWLSHRNNQTGRSRPSVVAVSRSYGWSDRSIRYALELAVKYGHMKHIGWHKNAKVYTFPAIEKRMLSGLRDLWNAPPDASTSEESAEIELTWADETAYLAVSVLGMVAGGGEADELEAAATALNAALKSGLTENEIVNRLPFYAGCRIETLIDDLEAEQAAGWPEITAAGEAERLLKEAAGFGAWASEPEPVHQALSELNPKLARVIVSAIIEDALYCPPSLYEVDDLTSLIRSFAAKTRATFERLDRELEAGTPLSDIA